MSLTDFICGLPKIELHLHIEGTLEPELMFTLAERNGVALPYANIDELRDAYDFHNLQSFLDLYYQGMNVLKTEQDFFDLAWAYFTRCAQDNLQHVEFFFDPQAHLERGVGLDVQFAGLNRACLKAEQTLGITSAIILSFLRDMTEASALATLDAALPYRAYFIGVGLDSAEMGNPPEKFVRVFERARAEGFHAVAHAGEEGPAAYIVQALDLLKIERIDHGVRCVEDAELLKRVAEEQIPLTVCPLSNVYLKVIDRMEDHTLPQLLAAGLNVTLNSDDPAYFGGYMNDNFLAVQKAFSFSQEQWVALTRNAINATFTTAARKQSLHDALDAYVAAA